MADRADRWPTPWLDLTDPRTLRGALEALLFVADAPIELTQLAAAVQRPATEVAEALAAITAELDAQAAGWQLRPAAPGFRLYTRDGYAPIVEAFLLEGQRSKLSQAALETLAVIAYRQPVTRARISAIRGVNVDGVVRTLLARGLITEVGTDRTPAAGCTGPPTRSWRRWASTRWTNCPRWRRCCRSWTPSTTMSCERPAGQDGCGCRRCWPAPGSVPGGPASS